LGFANVTRGWGQLYAGRSAKRTVTA